MYLKLEDTFSDLTTESNLNAIGEILIKDQKYRKSKVEELISKFELDAVRKVEAKFFEWWNEKTFGYKYVFIR